MTTTSTDIELNQIKAAYIQHKDLSVAASILYNAYMDDSAFQEIFQADLDGYESRLRSAIREELNIIWQGQQPIIGLFDEHRLLAVACLVDSSSSFCQQRQWHWRLKMLLTAGRFSTEHFLDKEQKVRGAIDAKIYFLLSFIAVHPHYQSMGLGEMLMSAVDSVLNEASDKEGIAVLVTTPKYQQLFKHSHYQELRELAFDNFSAPIMFKSRDKVELE